MGKMLAQATEKSPQRAILKNIGLDDEALSKPLVAVITSSVELAGGRALLELEKTVSAGIREGGGTPVSLPCSGFFADFTKGTAGAKYALPSRELAADSVEAILVSQMFEGAVLISGEAESLAGMTMGAVRSNIPFIVLPSGPMNSALVKGKKAGLSDVEEMACAMKAGKCSEDDLKKLEDNALNGDGMQNGLLHGNSLMCALEALGLSLPKAATAPASSGERNRIAFQSGKKIVQLLTEDVRPKMILSRESFTNAITVLSSINTATSAVIDLIAIAAECNIELSLDHLQAIATKTPLLVKLVPDSQLDMSDFHSAGGVTALMAQLASNELISVDCRTVMLDRVSKVIENVEVLNADVIHKMESPISKRGSFTLLKGNLAEDGAIIKTAGYERKNSVFKGKAVCFNSEEDAVYAINSGDIKEESVIVIRYEGPIGGPGMRELSSACSAINGKELAGKVAIITDGRLPGNEKGFNVGCISPEAAAGGKLAIVNNGDTIKIDLVNYKVDVDVPMKELLARGKKYHPKANTSTDLLLRYSTLCLPSFLGAGMKKNPKNSR